jgi:hypothetical protein
MKRALTGLLAALPLLLAPVAAGAHENEGTGVPSGAVTVVGKITSVNPNGSFVASAAVVAPHGDNQGGDDQGGDDQGEGYIDPLGPPPYTDPVGPPHHGGWGGPRRHSGDAVGPLSSVTITPGPGTRVELNGHSASASDLAAGDTFSAAFAGAPGDSLDSLASNPPLVIVARSAPKHRSLYAFVGTVSATDTTNGTVTVTITRTLPASLAPAGSSATFTVGPDTLVLGTGSGSSLFGGSLSGVQPGDVVAGGLMADSGLTLAQVSPQPLRLLLDLPAGTSLLPSHASRSKVARVKTSILHRALSILNGTTKVKVVKQSSSHKHASHKHASSHHSHKSTAHAKAHTKHSRVRHH